MSTIRTWIQTTAARLLVGAAILAAPQAQADKLREITRPIWRPGA